MSRTAARSGAINLGPIVGPPVTQRAQPGLWPGCGSVARQLLPATTATTGLLYGCTGRFFQRFEGTRGVPTPSILEPPWSLRIQDEAPLTLVAVVRGNAWVVPDDGDAERIVAGNVAILRGPNPYTFADDPATSPQVVIHPGQVCTTIDGEDLAQRMDLSVRTWGNDPDGSTVMLTGTYEMHSGVGRRLLRSLPQLVVLREGTEELPVISLLNQEISKEEPGQEAVLDRLLDLLLIAVLRSWFSRPEADAPDWYRAYGDPLVGPAVRMLQDNPARPWTVASLANEVGVSRATLARRFTELVGVPRSPRQRSEAMLR